ncbi:hypothetical protein EX30DRAFT_109173 [Ascodesmis nigricans]|uniref:S-adenosyl-L-methionine-dependent methyltransferase n=1 Tax=Ascodesmis nigricans TaxID=341454 RepID=A0A4S2MQI6_9PEZI|nr:hypothetical protein EX30DRAFT_109173 [Ascodesmis nigricans]
MRYVDTGRLISGETHPDVKVTGVDLMPIQPTWTYPNVVFETDDIEKNWTYPKNHFDFFHSRHLGMSIRGWRRYAAQFFAHIKLGGWVELSEHTLDPLYCDDDTLKEDSSLSLYYRVFRKSLELSGLDPGLSAEGLMQVLREAGSVDVSHRMYKNPWVPWPRNKRAKYLGAVAAECIKTRLEAYGMNLMTKVGEMEENEAASIMEDAVREVRSGKVHGYHNQWQITGRKPVEGRRFDGVD